MWLLWSLIGFNQNYIHFSCLSARNDETESVKSQPFYSDERFRKKKLRKFKHKNALEIKKHIFIHNGKILLLSRLMADMRGGKMLKSRQREKGGCFSGNNGSMLSWNSMRATSWKPCWGFYEMLWLFSRKNSLWLAAARGLQRKHEALRCRISNVPKKAPNWSRFT